MRDVDLEVCERESEALREPGVLLFRFSPEPQPAEHRLQLVTQVPVAACPRAAVAGTRMRVIPFRIEMMCMLQQSQSKSESSRAPERHALEG